MRWGGNDVFRIDGVLSVARPCQVDERSLREAFMWKTNQGSEHAFVREIYLDMEYIHLIDNNDVFKPTRMGSNLTAFWRSVNVVSDIFKNNRIDKLDGVVINGTRMYLFTPDFFKFKKIR